MPREADFISLVGLYPPEEGRTKKSATSWWSAVILIFTQAEMIAFISDIKTLTGTKDKIFGFGFDEPTKIYQTRGDVDRSFIDYSSHLLRNQVEAINSKFGIK